MSKPCTTTLKCLQPSLHEGCQRLLSNSVRRSTALSSFGSSREMALVQKYSKCNVLATINHLTTQKHMIFPPALSDSNIWTHATIITSHKHKQRFGSRVLTSFRIKSTKYGNPNKGLLPTHTSMNDPAMQGILTATLEFLVNLHYLLS